ncbi:MAG: hypothetical protein CMJ59_09095 [Planctomycetaceae bacterium]|nr:hypothetical protein [Planctomycetaceae bacterium]
MLRECKAVLFDAVGTLIYPDPEVAAAYHQAGREHGSRMSLDRIVDRFRDAFSRQEDIDRNCEEVDASAAPGSRTEPTRSTGPVRYIHSMSLERQPTSEPRERDRWRRIIQDVFEDVPQADQSLFDQLWAHFGQSQNWSLFRDVELTWSRLIVSDRLVGIASNFDARLSAICQKLPPLEQANAVFCSSEIGFPKPSPRFFREVESRLQMRPDEILLVGNDRENDLCGALAAGWHGLHLNRAAVYSDQSTITSLEELLVLLAAE